MPDELSGFEPGPTFNLAALAGQELLQARIRELENERAGKVLVDPEDLRRGVAFGRRVGYPAPGIVDVLDRLSDAAGSAPSGRPTSPESDAEHAPHSPGAPDAQEGSQRAGGDRT